MFTAVANGTKTPRGTHAAVEDVTRAAESLPQSDYMEVVATFQAFFELMLTRPLELLACGNPQVLLLTILSP